MAHLRSQFNSALTAIEPDVDKANAPEAHTRVRQALEADPLLSSYGIDPILIGSYKRNVSIKRVKDVDVFARMTDLPDEVTSKQILDRFFSVLATEFGNDDEGNPRVIRQDRSLQVRFPDFDLYVDAVPARPLSDGSSWEIPKRGSADEWVQTNPTELTSLSSKMNETHDKYYVPTVKLLRQTRRTILGKEEKPGGFFIEILAFHAFSNGHANGESQAEYYTTALRAMSNMIAEFVTNSVEVPDPTLTGKDISVRATEAQFVKLDSAFRSAADSAEQALGESEGDAAVIYRALLGDGEDGEPVFPMPEGFNDDGTVKESMPRPGKRTVPGGDERFG
jgi:hypothetical protein